MKNLRGMGIGSWTMSRLKGLDGLRGLGNVVDERCVVDDENWRSLLRFDGNR